MRMKTIPICIVGALACVSTFLSGCVVMDAFYEQRLQVQLQTPTPVQLAILDICNQFPVENDDLEDALPRSGEGYVQIANNDHVLVWMDYSGDALWFDIADSLSSFGYICIREGSSPQTAIHDYDNRVERGEILHIRDNLYYFK